MATKKDYFKNAKIGKINKVALNNFFEQSPSYEINLTKIDYSNGDYEGTFKGKVKIMSYSKNFEDQVLEFMAKIDNKVDNIEKDVKDIKSRLDVLESLPTIQKELKNSK